MDVRRLELLLALSRLGSMHAVSDTLGVTTSTVSQQIAALAKEVGLPLIEPDGRRVRLTPAGRRLAAHAVHILAAHEAAPAPPPPRPAGGPDRDRPRRRLPHRDPGHAATGRPPPRGRVSRRSAGDPGAGT